MASVVVLGSCNTDLVLNTDVLPQSGQTVLGRNYFQAAGGKGANQAVAARRSGADVTFVSAVGDDQFGSDAIERMQQEGVDVSSIRQFENAQSGVAIIMVDGQGRNLIGVAPGANEMVNLDFMRSLHDSLFENADVFVTQWETPRDAVRESLRRAHAAGSTTILNPAPVDPHYTLEDDLSYVQVLVLNEPEAQALSKGLSHDAKKAGSDKQLNHLFDHLHQLGANSILLTMGENGYWLSSADQRLKQPAHTVQAVDTVGAGDTFVGALAAKLAEGESLAIAAQWANAAAALSVTKPGAQPSIPSREATDQFLVSIDHSHHSG